MVEGVGVGGQTRLYAPQLGLNMIHKASAFVVCYSLFGVPELGDAVFLAALLGGSGALLLAANFSRHSETNSRHRSRPAQSFERAS